MRKQYNILTVSGVNGSALYFVWGVGKGSGGYYLKSWLLMESSAGSFHYCKVDWRHSSRVGGRVGFSHREVVTHWNASQCAYLINK